jgi:hypothetical protein
MENSNYESHSLELKSSHNSNLIFEISSMIFQGACLGKTNKLIKVAPCVIMVKARNLVQKGNNTMPKEI